MSRISERLRAVAGPLLALALLAPSPPRAKDPQIGESFRVPYLRTLTNHYLVRVRINGHGPFNFLVDTGAPALFIGSEAAKAAELEEPKDERTIWTPIDRFDIEGGATLHGIKAHIRDVFQLKGMNALGLPGARIDGIMGYTVLARYRMEFDPREDRLTWTRLDFEPREPYVPEDPKDRAAPPEVQAMEMIGPMMQFMSLLMPKQLPDVYQPQGLLGIELTPEKDGTLMIGTVLPETPAAAAGVKTGDTLVAVQGISVKDVARAHEAIAKIRPGEEVTLRVRRGSEELKLKLTAAEGL